MQRSATVIDQFKKFYERPLEQMVRAFLDSESESYENLMRRIRHSKADKAFLIQYISQYEALLSNPKKLTLLPPAKLTLLGLACERGWIQGASFSEAFLLYKIAASKKNGTALLLLGWLYEKGAGVEKRNYEEAKNYYLQAAHQYRSSTAALRLGKLYLNNKLEISSSIKIGYTDPNYMLAFVEIFGSYNVAADQYFRAAREMGNVEIDVMFTRKMEIPGNGWPKQYCKRAAAAGVPGCLIQLGVSHIYENVINPTTNDVDSQTVLDEARLYFEAVLDQGEIAGLEALCWASTKVQVDDEYFLKAISYAEKFLEAGDYNAAFYLAWLTDDSVPDAAHYYRLAAESARFDLKNKARENLRSLYVKTKDPSVLYQSCLHPNRESNTDLVRELYRNDLYDLARNQSEIFQELVQAYKDTWDKVMMLFDPKGMLTPSVQFVYFNLSKLFPQEVISSILNFYSPNLYQAVFMKSMMYDEFAMVVQSIFSKKWIQEKQEAQCDARIVLQGKDKKYVKRVPKPEVERWEICQALRNGTALFSVKEGLNRIKLIEQKYPNLYPAAIQLK